MTEVETLRKQCSALMFTLRHTGVDDVARKVMWSLEYLSAPDDGVMDRGTFMGSYWFELLRGIARENRSTVSPADCLVTEMIGRSTGTEVARAVRSIKHHELTWSDFGALP